MAPPASTEHHGRQAPRLPKAGLLIRGDMIAAMVRHAAAVRIGSLLLIALVVGVFTVRDYGESWDEPDNFRYADYAIQSYRYLFHPADLPPFETNLNLKGPAYFMLAEAGAGILTRIIPAWSVIEARHFINFLAFLAGSLMIYLLCRRWVSEAAALGATALFLTQPLLWGHAFINPKDIPFMALFSASVAAGMSAVDRYGPGGRFRIQLVLASVLLGLTTSVRVIAPLAAVIVLGYGIWKLRAKVILPAVLYAAIAMLTTFLTWPYLWSSPISHLLESAGTMADFPFATLILFGGHLYKAAQLPWSYFPTLLGLQLTEPMLLLLAGGAAVCIWRWPRKQYREPAGLVVAWFLVPLLSTIGYGSALYDNGRQLYFLLPPLFILAGVAFDAAFVLLARPWVRAAVAVAAVLPGLLLGIRLHPYEYVYYNILTGGTGGAYREFEMDYWGISFMELTTQLNAVAARDARVLVFGPEQIVAAYARPDIQTAIPREASGTGYNYAMLLTRENLDERRCKGAVTVAKVERRGAVLAVLKRIPTGVECE